jgi:hypothetical protein
MKRLKATIPNGGAPLGQFPVLRDIFDTETKDAIEALLISIVDGETEGVILSGCEVTGTSGNFAISAGYVYLDGKVLRYAGGSGFSATRYLQKAADTEETGAFADAVVRAYIDVETAEDAGSAPGGGVQYVTVTHASGGRTLNDLIKQQATTTVRGMAEIATQGEVNDGSDDNRIVTPNKIANATGIIDTQQLADNAVTNNKIDGETFFKVGRFNVDNWDMNTAPSYTVDISSLGLSTQKDILFAFFNLWDDSGDSVNVFGGSGDITTDSETVGFNTNLSPYDGSSIRIDRANNSTYASGSTYNDGAVRRGVLVIGYSTVPIT